MDSLETLAEKRKRAPVEGVMNSDVPAHTQEKRCRARDLHLASVADKEAVKEHAEWRHTEMKSRLGTLPQVDPSESAVATSVWVAEKRNRILSQELWEEEVKSHGDLASDAKDRELSARKQFKVSSPEEEGAQGKVIVDTR